MKTQKSNSIYPTVKQFFSDCQHVCGLRHYHCSVCSGRLWRNRKHCGKYCQHNHLTHDNTMILNVFKFFVCKFVPLPKIINIVVSLIRKLLLLIQKLVMNAHVQLQVCFFPKGTKVPILVSLATLYSNIFAVSFLISTKWCCIVAFLYC